MLTCWAGDPTNPDERFFMAHHLCESNFNGLTTADESKFRQWFRNTYPGVLDGLARARRREANGGALKLEESERAHALKLEESERAHDAFYDHLNALMDEMLEEEDP